MTSKSYESDYLNSKKTQLWVILSLCVLCVGIGVPVWWKTTEVYRATLPFDQIEALSNDKGFRLKVAIEIENTVAQFDAAAFAKSLKTVLYDNDLSSIIQFVYEINTFDFDHAELSSEVSSNIIKVVFKLNADKNMKIEVTDQRVIFCYLTNAILEDQIQLQQLQEKLSLIIKDVLINSKLLSAIVMNKTEVETISTQNDLFRKAIKASPKFELVFSLLCPDPENILAEWDISKLVNGFMKPMVDKLEPVFHFDIGSQILYYVEIFYRPKVLKVDNSTVYYVTQSQLTHVINPIEAKLGSQLSSNPTLNFAVYVVEKNRIPLYIQKRNKQLSESNSFLVPRWGAMMFYNVEDINSNDRQRHEIDMNRVMSSFLGPFRTLFGVPSYSHLSTADIYFEPPIREGLTDWELDYLMRLRLTENLASATHTLHSLSMLLSKISNIVINNDIAEQVYTAVNAITTAKKYAGEGKLSDALRHSKIAFDASETAFFDPTLLELLYFPEDQKFAIYVPLFLPISLPLIVSILKLLKRYKESKNRNQNNVDLFFKLLRQMQ